MRQDALPTVNEPSDPLPSLMPGSLYFAPAGRSGCRSYVRAASQNQSCSDTSRGSRTGKPSARNSASVSRSEEHTSELQSLMRNSYAVFCLKKQIYNNLHIIYFSLQHI